MIEFLWANLNPIVLIGELMCLIIFASICNYQSKNKITALALLLIPLFFVGIELAIFGLPHYWSPASLAGKLLVYYFVYLMLLGAVFFLSFVLPEEMSAALKTVISSIIGGVILYLSPGVILVLMCWVTGDCV